MRNLVIKFSLAIALLGAVSVTAYAQNVPDDSDFQSWNDLQITAPLAKNLDLYTVTTIQFGGNLSNVDNTRFGAGVTIKPAKGLSITPFVTFISRRNSSGNYRYEYRHTLRGVYKYQFEHFALAHRSQFEYRARPGRNTWRYRPSVTVEKALPKSFVPGLKVFVTEEPFYDSASGWFSRNRISAGVTKSLNKKLSVDVYFLHQGDNFSTPGTINVIGTAFKLAL
jgi:hypothetical protein